MPAGHELTDQEKSEIAEILGRRANDVASFQDDVKKWTGDSFKEFPGSVEMALTREVQRLRFLKDRLLSNCEEKTDDEKDPQS